MNKTELAKKIAEKSGISKTQAAQAINVLADVVAESLKSGDPVTITGFGTFSVSKRAARTGHNPQTG